MTVHSEADVELLGGIVPAATGDAIVDCVAEGVLPRDQVDELCMIVIIWLDPRCATDEGLDRRDLYRNNYEATRLAVARAVKSADELISNRRKIRHHTLEGVLDDET